MDNLGSEGLLHSLPSPGTRAPRPSELPAASMRSALLVNCPSEMLNTRLEARTTQKQSSNQFLRSLLHPRQPRTPSLPPMALTYFSRRTKRWCPRRASAWPSCPSPPGVAPASPGRCHRCRLGSSSASSGAAHSSCWQLQRAPEKGHKLHFCRTRQSSAQGFKGIHIKKLC